MADSTTFEIDIKANGGQAQSAADAVSLLADRLSAASAASNAAADAVKASETAYSQAESAANRTAVALEKITLAAQAQAGKVQAALEVGDLAGAERAQAKFSALISKQGELAAKSTAAKSALEAEAATLDRLKGAAAGAVKAEEQIAAAHQKAAATAKATASAAAASAGSGKVNEIAEGLGKLGGPLGVAGQKAFGAAEGLKKLGASLGSAGPYVAIAVVVVALAAGLGVLAIAAAGAAVKISMWAVANGDAARTQELVLAGIARSARGGDELAASIDGIERSTGLTSDKIQEMAKKLADAGLRGKALTDKLEETATEAAKLEFGPDYQKRLLSMDVQTARFKKNISQTFSIGSDKLEPLLKGLQSLIQLFDIQNASGRAMQTVFRSMFEPLIEGATNTIPKLRTSFIQAEISILKGLIQLKLLTKEYGTELRYAGAAVAILSAVIIGGLVLALAFVAVNLILIGAAFGFVVGVVTALIAGSIYLGAQMIALGVAANNAIIGNIKSAFDWLASVSLSDIGTAMIDGLVNGITASAAKVVTALKGVVDGAVKTAKTALGVASPSKVFAEIGGYTAEGMAKGVSDGTSDVQSTISDMVAPPDVAAAPVAASGGKADGGGGGVRDINIYGVRGAEDLLEELKLLAIQLGAAVPA